MKIAIIGAPDSVEKIYSILSSEYKEVSFFKYPKEKIEEMIPLIQKLENDVDGIYLTGIGIYSSLNLKTDLSNKAIVYTKRGEMGIIKAFLSLQKDYESIDNLKIGIDLIEEKMLKDVFEEYEIQIKNYYLQKYEYSKTEEEYLKNYLEKLKTKEIDCVITAFGYIYYYLKRLNLPVYRLQATNTEIKLEFKKLELIAKIEELKKTGIGVQIIKLIKKNISELTQKTLQNKNSFETQLLEYAKEIQGNIQFLGNEEYYILANKGLLLDEDTLKIITTLIKNTTKKDFYAGIGIGEGQTILQAEANGRKALKISLSKNKNEIYFYDGKNVSGPLLTENMLQYSDSVNKDIFELSKKIGISSTYLEKLKSIIKKYGKNTFSSKELAEIFEISERSVNRLLKKIIENGYGEEAEFENTPGAGRPRRKIKFNF
ncbi:HTH domain-containing protein [Fusobacterium ulcerans]|uniref:HTH domain-containing protein n=1 Tax=Fusobacterium ulcerans TaxID=861 RepID=UPI0010304974|nr:HTH domain-containing protein [Fusobacterium ulcerans]